MNFDHFHNALNDLDVVRIHVGRLYQGAAMTIEENIGNGQFKRVLTDEWCAGPKSKADLLKKAGPLPTIYFLPMLSFKWYLTLFKAPAVTSYPNVKPFFWLMPKFVPIDTYGVSLI